MHSELTWKSHSFSLLNSSWDSCSALPWCIKKQAVHICLFFVLPTSWIKESCRADKVAQGWQLLWRAEAHMFSSGYALPVWYCLKVCLHLTCTYTVISVKWWAKSVRVTTGNHPHLCYFIIIIFFFLRFALVWSWCQTHARQHCALAGMSAQFP